VERNEVHLRDYLAVIRRHGFVIIISFLLIFGSALIVSLYLPRIYEATATIEIQQSTAPSGISGIMQNFISRGVDQVSMETICKRFVSNSVLNETIRNLKKRSLYTYRDLTPEFLAPRISAKIVPDTKMIEVKIKMRRDEGGSQRAAKIANELIQVIQDQRGEKTDAEIVRRQNFINEKIKSIESQIGNSDQNIKTFLKNKGNTIAWSARAEYLFNRISSLTDVKEMNESVLSAEQKIYNELKTRLSKEPEFIEYSRTLSQDVLWGKYKTDLADLNMRLIDARAEFGDGYPRVKALQDQVNQINSKMKNLAQKAMEVSTKTESRNPTHQTLLDQLMESELNQIVYSARRDAAIKLLKQLTPEKEQILSEMPQNQYELDKMNREVGYKMDVYKDLLTKKVEAEIMALDSVGDNTRIKGGIEVIDLAQPSSRPVSPRIKFIVTIASIVGFTVGLAMAFLTEYIEKV
jgi:uncharacterized protein involved in exopolysaccharide biosynthesis